MDFNFITYMKNIAISLKAISHQEESETQKRFYRSSGLSDLSELLNNLTDPKMYPCIVANDLAVGKIGDNGPAENYLDTQSHIFYIVGYVDTNDFDAKQQSIEDLKAIMYKIIGKMRRDRTNDFKGEMPRTGLRTLNTSSIFYQVITGFGEHNHGIMVSFDITPSVHAELKYNADDWQ